jgi:hypothetical protein
MPSLRSSKTGRSRTATACKARWPAKREDDSETQVAQVYESTSDRGPILGATPDLEASTAICSPNPKRARLDPRSPVPLAAPTRASPEGAAVETDQSVIPPLIRVPSPISSTPAVSAAEDENTDNSDIDNAASRRPRNKGPTKAKIDFVSKQLVDFRFRFARRAKYTLHSCPRVYRVHIRLFRNLFLYLERLVAKL